MASTPSPFRRLLDPLDHPRLAGIRGLSARQFGAAVLQHPVAREIAHTVMRTPNGNDYGRDLLRQHDAQALPGHRPGCDGSQRAPRPAGAR